MRLQIGREVRDDAVRGGVRLVERVVGERHENIPEGRNGLGRETALGHSGGERCKFFVENFLLFLSHGSPKVVCLGERVSGNSLSNLHHLLLVNDQAVGRVENVGQRFRELAVNRSDGLHSLFAERVIGVRLGRHGTGAIERKHGRNIIEDVGLHLFEKLAHWR